MGVVVAEDGSRRCALPGCTAEIEVVPGQVSARYCTAAHRAEAREARRAGARGNDEVWLIEPPDEPVDPPCRPDVAAFSTPITGWWTRASSPRRPRGRGAWRTKSLSRAGRVLVALGAAGLLVGGYSVIASLPTGQTQAPVQAPVQAAPVDRTEQEWAAHAQIALVSVSQQLDTIAQTEAAWARMPKSIRAQTPPPVVQQMEQRKTLLQQRQAMMDSQLGAYRSLTQTTAELAQTEQQLAAVTKALTAIPPSAQPSPEQVALVQQRDLLGGQRDAKRQELANLDAGVHSATQSPLPDDAPQTAQVTDKVLAVVALVTNSQDGGSPPGSPSAPRPAAVGARNEADPQPRASVHISGPPDPRGEHTGTVAAPATHATVGVGTGATAADSGTAQPARATTSDAAAAAGPTGASGNGQSGPPSCECAVPGVPGDGAVAAGAASDRAAVGVAQPPHASTAGATGAGATSDGGGVSSTPATPSTTDPSATRAPGPGAGSGAVSTPGTTRPAPASGADAVNSETPQPAQPSSAAPADTATSPRTTLVGPGVVVAVLLPSGEILVNDLTISGIAIIEPGTAQQVRLPPAASATSSTPDATQSSTPNISGPSVSAAHPGAPAPAQPPLHSGAAPDATAATPVPPTPAPDTTSTGAGAGAANGSSGQSAPPADGASDPNGTTTASGGAAQPAASRPSAGRGTAADPGAASPGVQSPSCECAIGSAPGTGGTAVPPEGTPPVAPTVAGSPSGGDTGGSGRIPSAAAEPGSAPSAQPGANPTTVNRGTGSAPSMQLPPDSGTAPGATSAAPDSAEPTMPTTPGDSVHNPSGVAPAGSGQNGTTTTECGTGLRTPWPVRQPRGASGASGPAATDRGSTPPATPDATATNPDARSTPSARPAGPPTNSGATANGTTMNRGTASTPPVPSYGWAADGGSATGPGTAQSAQRPTDNGTPAPPGNTGPTTSGTGG